MRRLRSEYLLAFSSVIFVQERSLRLTIGDAVASPNLLSPERGKRAIELTPYCAHCLVQKCHGPATEIIVSGCNLHTACLHQPGNHG